MSDTSDAALSGEVRVTLRAGIVTAALLLVIGIALSLVHGTANILAPPMRLSLGALPTELIHGSGAAFILLGVLVLVFTPIARVLVSFSHFARTRDYPFSLITAFVLVILLVSVLIGLSP